MLAAPPACDSNEIISKTDDKTQGPLLHMPNLKPSSDELFAELEHYVAIIKESRAKDLEDCERIESIILRYKAVRNDEKNKATAALNSQLTRVEASLDTAREIIHAVVTLA